MTLRSRLEQNKIYFEIFASLVLGLAGVAVSYASLRTAQTQTALQRAQLMPRFRLVTMLVIDPDSARYRDEELTLHNDGYPVLAFDTAVRTAYEVRPSLKPGTTGYLLPIYYFSGEYPESRSQGHLRTYRQPFNNDHALRLLYELDLYNQKREEAQRYDVEMVTIVSISYVDEMEEARVEHYRLDPLRGGQRIPEDQALAWIRSYEQAKGKLRGLSDLHADGLIASALATGTLL